MTEEKLKDRIEMQLGFLLISGIEEEKFVAHIIGICKEFSKCELLVSALNDIKNWNDELDDKHESPGMRAKEALDAWQGS